VKNSNCQETLSAVAAELTASGRLAALSLRPDGFAFDEKTGQSYSLNPTAIATVEALRATGDVAETVATLARRYGLPESVIHPQVEAFLRQLDWYLT
jgi:hypothetical protein